jgi:hypothetical protein
MCASATHTHPTHTLRRLWAMWDPMFPSPMKATAPSAVPLRHRTGVEAIAAARRITRPRPNMLLVWSMKICVTSGYVVRSPEFQRQISWTFVGP